MSRFAISIEKWWNYIYNMRDVTARREIYSNPSPTEEIIAARKYQEATD